MPRLIDDIRAQGGVRMPAFVSPDRKDIWEAHTIRVMQMLQDPAIPVLLIDNVAEYYFTGTDQEDWDLTRDFPNLAPPFPIFWCEYHLSRTIHSKRCGDTDLSRLLPQGGRVGQLFVAVDPAKVKGEGIPANAKWILWCELFVDYRRRDAAADGTHGQFFLCIDAEGRLIGNPWTQSFASAEDADIVRSFMTWFHPPLLAISFLHCKNVTIVDNPAPPKLARRYRERHKGAQMASYKTLVIEPLKQILRTQGRSGEHGVAKAIHICRGHFRDYREGRGLFGKYHQLVWSPSVVRGAKGKDAPPREIEVKV